MPFTWPRPFLPHCSTVLCQTTGRKFLLYHCYSSLKFLSELFFLHEIIYEGVMHTRICLERTVSTDSVTVTFKAKPIAAADIIKTACT